MRITRRVVQNRVDTLNHEIRYRMFEHLGFVMHTVPGVTQSFHQESFDQAVAANHGDRIGAPQRGEFDGAVALMVDQIGRRKSFKPV